MDLVSRFYSREDFHQSLSHAKVMERIGWSSIPIGESRLAVRSLGPVSLAKMQRSHVIDFPKLLSMRKKLKFVQLVIEPAITGEFVTSTGKVPFSFASKAQSQEAVQIFSAHGFFIGDIHFAHSKTAILDLTPSLLQIQHNFPSKTRYNVTVSLRKRNVYTITSFSSLSQKNTEAFFTLHDEWSKERKIFGFSNDFLRTVISSFLTEGFVLTCKTDGVLSGVMLVLIHDRIAYYFYTFTSQMGRKFHVPTGLTYTAIKLAKEQGADIFDFCSMYDERYPKEYPRWKGFSQFKSRFLPIDIYYPPTFVRRIL